MSLSRRSFLTWAGATASVAALGGLSACAGTGGSAAGQEGDGTIKFWSNHPAKSKDVEQKIIDAWNAANPKTPVQLIDGGANYEELAQKFNAALTGGQLPDVIVASDVNWFNFALNGATAPLDDLWTKAGVKPDTYVDTLREDYKLNGKHFAMPYARSTNLMYLDNAIFEKAGLDPKVGPATWQQFAEWAPSIRKANGGKPVLAIPDGSNYLDWYFQGMIWTFGGHYSRDWTATFTDPKSIEAGKFLQDQVKQGNIAVSNDAVNQFATGGASALLESTGSLTGLTASAKTPFTTAYLPGPKPGAATGGAGLSVPAGISEDRKLNAVKFIDFLTNTQNTITFTQATGYMPVRKDAEADPAEKMYLEQHPNATTAIRQLNENTQPQDAARVFVQGGGKRIGAALDRITIGGEDVATVFAQLQDETQKIIDRDIKPKLSN
ncbi:sn-glycerol 3-phosphate transport system substrate-binding protein [Raineyella antarctica]|uniref:sn-glycerol 3-phosphate transport system substrate-binding protein n=1 Tax=Raineyella antarctica TaxID=1577474 RepID=A0A1G6HQJ5_9ACTN|nr:ABC transporter substrate-binding protein [Raineyella antarctica]SDB95756.1 sn-glycerol 3-phosphate transport system substrate-binding protein [Raineyella antarctica]